MTKLEIINETVNYYKTHKRGVLNNNTPFQQCAYYGKYREMCAVGRCLINPKELIDGNLSVDGIENFENLLKPQYRNHHIDFWVSLQIFHDINHNWKIEKRGNILTTPGQNALKTLIIKYGN